MTSLVQTRVSAINRRRERIEALVREGRPTAAIAEIVGLNYNDCQLQVTKIRREHGLARTRCSQDAAPVGLTAQSHHFRSRLGDYLHRSGQQQHPVDYAAVVGIPPQSQSRALQRPFHFNWNLGQIERLAEANEIPFRELVLRSVLTAAEYKRVSQCIKI